MERKIGEIFEYNGEWYQCMKSNTCNDCAFYRNSCGSTTGKGFCRHDFRKDVTNVIFKKLEKVGEPYTHYCPSGRIIYFQRYKIFNKSYFHNTEYIMCDFNEDGIISIEIKQKQEDMKEKNLNLKPFDLEAAKAGKPVCTRDGRKARIICFDAKGSMPIVALISNGDDENLHRYYNSGSNYVDNDYDLMMLPEKKEGWVNVYRDCDGVNITKDDNIYSSKDAAISSAQIIDRDNYVATTIIKWEE